MSSFRRPLLLLLLGAACLAWTTLPASADDRIWSAIVLASQTDKPKPAPPELQKLAPKIERFFNCNQLELIGSATKEIDETSEKWLVPSQHFWLCVTSRRPPGEKVYTMKVALFHDQRSLVETEAKMAPESPLLIRGPMHARGQLLIVVLVQK